MTANRTPKASSESASKRMRSIRQTGTALELAVRSELHARGYRFRTNAAILAGRKIKPDISIKKLRLAVFIDGCFWHGCPIHGSFPKANCDWWKAKIDGNKMRDQMITATLAREGWTVIRAWGHENSLHVAQRIIASIDELRRLLKCK